ncbi:hypothetical protein D3C81_1716210 [compost metagenome]
MIGLGLRLGNDVRHAGGARALGVGDQHVGHHGQQRDRGEVLDGVVVQVLVQRGVDRHAIGHDQDGVAVRLGARHAGRADVAARARAVLHDEGCVELLAHGLAQGAGDAVHGAAGREGHDPFDRTVGIAVRQRGGRAAQHRERQEGAGKGFEYMAHAHGCLRGA